MKRKADDIEAIMQEGVQQALELAEENGLKFDFSDESIKEVEKVLDEIHKEYKKTGEEEGLFGLGLILAAYIGEVIRKKGLGGTWERSHPDFGEDTFPFHWCDGVLFLHAWCMKRILDGSGDDVSFKYHCMVLDKIGKKD